VGVGPKEKGGWDPSRKATCGEGGAHRGTKVGRCLEGVRSLKPEASTADKGKETALSEGGSLCGEKGKGVSSREHPACKKGKKKEVLMKFLKKKKGDFLFRRKERSLLLREIKKWRSKRRRKRGKGAFGGKRYLSLEGSFDEKRGGKNGGVLLAKTEREKKAISRSQGKGGRATVHLRRRQEYNRGASRSERVGRRRAPGDSRVLGKSTNPLFKRKSRKVNHPSWGKEEKRNPNGGEGKKGVDPRAERGVNRVPGSSKSKSSGTIFCTITEKEDVGPGNRRGKEKSRPLKGKTAAMPPDVEGNSLNFRSGREGER